MPEVTVDKGTTLDLLDQQKPGTSTTSDMPVVETHPDAVKKPDAAAAAKPQDDEESATSDQPGQTPASDAPKKPAQGVQKRLDELTRQREDEKRSRIATEQRLEKALGLLETAMKGKPAQAETDAGDPEPAEPDVAKYTDQNAYNADYRQYLRNLAKWEGRATARQTLKEEREALQRRREEEGHRKMTESYQARVAKAREKYQDYDAKVYSDAVPFTRPMADAIAESEHGPDVAYFLADNPAEFDRISKLSPRAQVMELGYLSAQFRQAAKTEPVKAPVSQAPRPIRPITSGTASAAPSGGEETMEAYAARRSKELAKERVPGGVRR